MAQRTPLYDAHLAAGARMVPFAGWEMPIHYGSQIEEHHAVRGGAGMFDVSHMNQMDLEGPQAEAFLRMLLPNDVARLAEGQALYSCMLNEQGGILDDLIVYRLAPGRYRVVANAATREPDLAWIRAHLQDWDARLDTRSDLAMIAVQGPRARDAVLGLLDAGDRARVAALDPFHAAELGSGWLVGRTGYTGEDGFEIMLPGGQAPGLWERLLGVGVRPAGLGARDTLRLEAGMLLYGQDMDESVTPLESGLGWTVAWEPADRAFIGREALEVQRAAGPTRRLVGLVLEGRAVPRAGYAVHLPGGGSGVVTSGTFSPTLQRGIALARVPTRSGEAAEVEIRGRRVPARVVKPRLVRHGKALID
jgi:aminomethyltransferase